MLRNWVITASIANDTPQSAHSHENFATVFQGGAQRGEQMRREVVTFVQGVAKGMLVPEAASFADALVTKLLAGVPSDIDSVAAWSVYGPLARDFC